MAVRRQLVATTLAIGAALVACGGAGAEPVRWGDAGIGSVAWGASVDEALAALVPEHGEPERSDLDCVPPRTDLTWPGFELVFSEGFGLQGDTVSDPTMPSTWGFRIGDTVETARQRVPALRFDDLMSNPPGGSRWHLDRDSTSTGASLSGSTTGVEADDVLRPPVHAAAPRVVLGCTE